MAADTHPAFARFLRIGIERGLSQISALALVQDRHGFVWVGTQDGLNRFDGYEFRQYHADPQRPDGLPDDRVNALVVDHDGVLWAGTRGGLGRYLEEEDRFVRVLPEDPRAARPAEEDVRALRLDGDGRLWVGTHGGLMLLDPADRMLIRLPAPQDLRIESLAADADGGIWVGTLGGLFRFDRHSGRYDQPWTAAAAADDGLHGRVDAVAVDTDGALWIGAVGAGVYRFDPQAVTLARFRHAADDLHSIGSNHVRTLQFDRSRRLWIGTREGLDLVTERGPDVLRVRRFAHSRNDPWSLGNGRVMSLLEDHTGALWVGNYNGGVSLLSQRGNRFSSFGPQRLESMRDPVVHKLEAAGENELWVGSRNGLYRFDLALGELRLVPGSDRMAVGAIVPDGERLWVSASAGLARMVDGQIEPISDLPSDLSTARITALRVDRDLVWFGTYDRGLFVLSREDFASHAVYPTRTWISTIELYSDRLLLASGADGLHWLQRDSGERVHRHRTGVDADADLPAGGVSGFLRARNGRMWLASVGGGLIEMRLADPDDPATAQFVAFDGNHLLDSTIVHTMLEDRRGQLWLSTLRGISRVDPASGEVRNFGAADGAFDGDYGTASGTALADGRLVFGASEGFVVFDPERVGEPAVAPAPLLTELRLWNRRVRPGSERAEVLPQPLHLMTAPVTLPAAQAQMLGLRFASTDFAAPERLRYAYRLDGFDYDWIEATASERSATYTNLSPGEYLFRVKAGESDESLAGAAESRLAIHILPPWWQTWWARGLALAVLVGLLLTLHLLRLRGADRRRRALERQVAERTRELSVAKERAESALQQLQGTQRQLVEAEKMASLGQLVAGIAHEINTPIGIAVTAASHLQESGAVLTAKLAAGRLTRTELGKWNDSVDEAMRLILGSLDRAHALIGSFKQVAVDQASEQRRQFELDGFLREVQFALRPTYRRSGHSLSIDCAPGILLDTYPGALFRILTNWISNSITHGFADRGPGQMAISVRDDGGWVELHFEDDGAGMPPEVAQRAFDPFFTTRRGTGGSGLGLHLVYNLANQLLGGSITLSSAQGAGTRFVLRLPKIAPTRPAAAVAAVGKATTA